MKTVICDRCTKGILDGSGINVLAVEETHYDLCEMCRSILKVVLQGFFLPTSEKEVGPH